MIGNRFKNSLTTVEITRVSALSGYGEKQFRWVYYKNLATGEKHCQRLDLFLKNYDLIKD